MEVEDEVGEGGLVQGIGERRPVLVRIDEGGVWCCSARPELEEEDVRRRQSAAKVRWWVEGLRVGELASPCGGAQANMVFPYPNWGSIQLKDKTTWWVSANIM